MKAERSADISYEWTLRAMGAHLDNIGARFMSLVETPTGLAVRYRESDGAPGFSQFSIADLRGFMMDLRQKRGRPEDDERPLTAEITTTYQDWFRALGWELDQSGAYNVVCDELQESILVTYQHLDSSVGYAVEKRMAVLGPLDRRSIVDDAHARRKQF